MKRKTLPDQIETLFTIAMQPNGAVAMILDQDVFDDHMHVLLPTLKPEAWGRMNKVMEILGLQRIGHWQLVSYNIAAQCMVRWHKTHNDAESHRLDEFIWRDGL